MTVSGETTQETTQQGVILTDAAAEKARGLLEQEGRDDLALRVAVQPGSCSASSTSSSSTSGRWTGTRSRTSAASRCASTG